MIEEIDAEKPTEQEPGKESPAPLGSGQVGALRDAADILETEANQLVSYMKEQTGGMFTWSGKLTNFSDPKIPHRITLAINSEVGRLRSIANTLRDLIPTSDSEDDE